MPFIFSRKTSSLLLKSCPPGDYEESTCAAAWLNQAANLRVGLMMPERLQPENALVRKLTIQLQLHVTRAFEFLEDHFIHFRTCVNQRCCGEKVSEPPFSIFLAAPKNCFGLCKAFASTPPDKTFPDAGCTVLWAPASRVMELRKQATTSIPHSTIRFAFSRAIAATFTCLSAGSSNVEAITSALTFRSMSVTSSGRSSTSNTIG